MAKLGYRKPVVPNFRKVVNRARDVAMKSVSADVDAFAAHHRDAFVKAVEDQSFQSFLEKPLSAKWLARKKAKHADERVMIATHHYLDSIQVMTDESKKIKRWNIGFAEDAVAFDLDHRPTALPLWRLALIHEYGSIMRHIPARPHWMPYLALMKLDQLERMDGIRKRAYLAVATDRKNHP